MGRRQPDGPLFKVMPNRPIGPIQRAAVARGDCNCGGMLDRLAYRDVRGKTRPWVACGYRCSLCDALYVDVEA